METALIIFLAIVTLMGLLSVCLGVQLIIDKTKEFKKYKHHYDTTHGLWAIDQHPKDVTKNWINENAHKI